MSPKSFLSSVCCSVAKSCPPLCDTMNCHTWGFPVLYCLPEFAQIHVHWVSDAIQPSHSLLPNSLLASFPTSGSFPMRLPGTLENVVNFFFFSWTHSLPRSIGGKWVLIGQLALAVTWEDPKNALQVLHWSPSSWVYLPTDPSCLSPRRLNSWSLCSTASQDFPDASGV